MSAAPLQAYADDDQFFLRECCRTLSRKPATCSRSLREQRVRAYPVTSDVKARKAWHRYPRPPGKTPTDETGSPVDLGCRIPAKCAFFTQRIREFEN